MERHLNIGHREHHAGQGPLDRFSSGTFARRGAILILYAGAVFLGGYSSLSHLQDALVAKQGADLARTAASMAQTLDAFFLERVDELEVLAQHPGISDVAPDTAGATLQHYARLSKSFSSIRIINAQGSTVAGSAPSLEAPRGRGWIQDVQRSGRPRLVSTRLSGTQMVTVSVPFDGLDGHSPGVLSGAIPVQTLHQILRARYTLLALEPQAQRWLVLDPTGTVVTDQGGRGVHHDDLRKLGQPSAIQASLASYPEGQFLEELDVRTQVPVVTGFARLAQQDPAQGFAWTVLVQADRAAVYGPVNRFLWVVGAVFTLLAGLAGFLGLGALQGLLDGPRRQGRDHRSLTGPTYYDAVTGLPGSRLFEMILGQAVDRMSLTQRTMALLAFDLKQLKIVSASQGKAGGDLAVRVLAARVKGCIRMSDAVARIGTDRFAVLLENLSAPEDAASIAQKILQTVVLPLTIGSEEILIDTRIGIALYASDATTANDLMACAEGALAAAQAEEVPISFYSKTLGERIFEGLAQESEADSVPESAVFRP